MTRLPQESWNMTGIEIDAEHPKYQCGPTCSVPGCTRLSDNVHHIVRRSFLAGPFPWVRMDDGVEIGNLTGLCWHHHEDVTTNKEQITYNQGVFYWTDGRTLIPQPPSVEKPVVIPDFLEPAGRDPENLPVEHMLEEGHDPEVCPTCKRKMPKPKIETPTEEKRPRQTWAIGIPVDERENGADVLDELLETCRDQLDKAGLSYGEGSKVKYFVLATTLGIFVQHAEALLSDA